MGEPSESIFVQRAIALERLYQAVRSRRAIRLALDDRTISALRAVEELDHPLMTVGALQDEDHDGAV